MRTKHPFTVVFLERIKKELAEGKPSLEIVRINVEDDFKGAEKVGYTAFNKDFDYTVKQLQRKMTGSQREDYLEGYLTLSEVLHKIGDKRLDDLLISKEEILMYERYCTMLEQAIKGELELQKEAYKGRRVKEIVREVIVKIRCPYCQKLYDEKLNTCPHCGASR